MTEQKVETKALSLETQILEALKGLKISVEAMDTKFQEMDTKLEKKFQEMDTKFQEMDTKFEKKFQEMDTKFEKKFQGINKTLNRLSSDLALVKGQTFEDIARRYCEKQFGRKFSKNYCVNSVCDLVRIVLSQETKRHSNATEIIDKSMVIMAKILQVLCFSKFRIQIFFV
jgi:catalase (peroxidase I)